ncbi:MAG: conserved hypothetical protein [Marine Group I thaumarchaeote]|nr:MAG: conserved hypothetical protein [Marine Group I thaumarchaeote]
MLLNFIFLNKINDLERRFAEFDYIKKMGEFYKFWIKKNFSKSFDVQCDQMIVHERGFLRRLDIDSLLEDHRKRGEEIYHFYLSFFRPLWTDCIGCEGYYAENFGMVLWDEPDDKNDVSFLAEKNCTKVSHELAHELLRQEGNKQYMELVHDVWDKHLFASLSYEHYNSNFEKTTQNKALFSTINTSEF